MNKVAVPIPDDGELPVSWRIRLDVAASLGTNTTSVGTACTRFLPAYRQLRALRQPPHRASLRLHGIGLAALYQLSGTYFGSGRTHEAKLADYSEQHLRTARSDSHKK